MSDPLPLHHLATLVAILDEGGFEAAATRLNVSGPAVSQRVRALEMRVGRALLHRTVPPTPTAAGERLLPHARRLVAMAHDAALAVGLSGPDGARPRLSLAVNADSLETWFLDALASAPNAAETDVLLERADQDHTQALLRSGEVAGAVTTAPEAIPGCRCDPLGVMRYLPVAAPALLQRHGLLSDVPAAAREQALAGLPLVDFDDTDELQRSALASWLGYAPTPPRHRVPSSSAFVRAVLLVFGWGMVPEEQARAGLERGALVPLPGGQTQDVALYWQRWEPAPAALESLSVHLLGFAAARLRPARQDADVISATA